MSTKTMRTNMMWTNMAWTKIVARTATLLLAAFLAGSCGSDLASDSRGAAEAPNSGSTGVGQSGAQDFGRFRAIIEAGELPSPDTLDAVGFFNEHKVELPQPQCAGPVCLHGALGVQGNMVNGSNCTVIMAGMNTALSPDDYERPPLNLSVVVDVSGSMQGAAIDAVRLGLQDFAAQLDPKDNVTLITYATDAQVLFTSGPEDIDRAGFVQAVSSIRAAGGTNIHSGLRLGLETVSAAAANDRQNRVILLSDGIATEGITDSARIVNLGKTYAEKGIGITTIGVGADFDLNLMRNLSNTGAGNFYFLEDPGAVREVFTEEASSFLIPLANDVRLSLDITGPYAVRGAYGTRIWDADDNAAEVVIPSLFMASRQTVDDVTPDGGRRGGGGAILFELVPIPVPELLEATPANHRAGTLTLEYTLPGSDQRITETVEVMNPLKPGETPENGEFENPSVEKSFVTLNVFVGFKLATERAAVGAPGAALAVLNPLIVELEDWLKTNDDADIEADLELMRKLVLVIERRSGPQETIGNPPNPWPYD